MSAPIRIRSLLLLVLPLLLLIAAPVAADDGDHGQDPPGTSAPAAQTGPAQEEVIDLATRAANLLLSVALL